jgi:hypothetical protein
MGPSFLGFWWGGSEWYHSRIFLSISNRPDQDGSIFLWILVRWFVMYHSRMCLPCKKANT